MLNLEELVFKVNTKELVDAVGRIKELGTEVANLAKPIDKAVSASDKLAKAQQQEATTADKAAKATTDLAAAETKAGKARGEAAPKIDTVTRSIEKQLTAMKVFRGEAINAADGAIALGTAFTKTQANQLAALKVSGATTEALKTMARSFEEFNKITSANTFDNSVAGIQRLRKEIAEMSKVDDLMRQGIKLTQDEIVNLVRDSERLTQQFKSEGLSAQQLDAALAGLTQEHVLLARQKNDLVARSKESERQAKAEANAQIKAAQDQARAVKYLEDTERRMAAAVDEANRGLDRGATDTLVKYKQALMQAGLAADVAEGKMATLKSQMDLVASRKRADELRYLSRALSVQMGDVAISLASGMNPLLVMIQQGDQIRGVLDQVGAQGDELRKSMTGAAAQIASGMKNTAIAIGTFLGGAFLGAGKYLNNFVAEVTGADKALLALKARVIALDGIMTTAAGPGKWVTTLRLASAAVVTFGGLIATTGIAALGAWGVGLYKVIQEENALAKQLALTGNAMGLSFDSALRLSRGMSDIGVSTGMAMKVLGEMAKVGGFVSSELQLIAKSATDMKTYFGVAIEDTVKAFAKMKKEPVEAMFELAKTTGMVSSETIKAIVELKGQGKTAEATALAIKTLASVNAQQVEQMKKDYNGFSLFMIELGKNIKSFYDEIFKSLFYKADPKKQLQEQIGAIEDILSGGGSIAGALARTFNEEGMKNQLGALKEQLRLMTQASDAQQRDATARAKEQANYQEALKLSESLASKQVKLKKELLEAEQKFKPLVDSGLLSQEKYNAILAGIRDKYKETNKESNELEKYQKRIEETIRDISNEVGNLGKKEVELTKASKARADIMDDPLWSKLTPETQKQLLATLALLDADERRFKEAEKRQKLVEEEWKKTIERQKESDKLYFDISDNLAKQSESLQESGKDLEFQYSLLGKSDDEVKSMTREYDRQNKLRKAFLDYEKSISDNRNLPADRRKELDDQAYLNYAEQVRQINSETARLYADDTVKEFNRVRDSISDVIVTALFEGGKSGRKKLRDLIVAELRKPITMVVNVAVNAMLNSLMGSISGGSSGGGSGGNSLSALSSLFGAGGFSGAMTAGAGWMTGAASLSQIWGAGASLMGTGSLAGILSGGSMLLGSIMPVLGVLSLLSGTGTPGEQHTGAMTSTHGSALDMATAMSITGGREGASRDLTTRYNADLAKVIKPIVEGAMTGVNSALTGLGMGGYTIDAGFAANTNGKGKNKNAFGYFNLYDAAGNLVKEYINRELGEDLTAALQKFGGDIQEAVASVVLEGTNFKREGETNAQALERLSTSLTAVNQVFDTLGYSVLNLSMASASLSSDLIDAFNGLDNFSNLTASYYQNFYSEEERFATSQRQLASQFESLNQSVPKTTAEFRSLVESQDLTTDAGRKMYAALLNLSPAFYEVISAAEQMRAQLQQERSEIEGELLQALGASAELRRRELEAILPANRALQQLVWTLQDAVSSVDSALASVRESGQAEIAGLQEVVNAVKDYQGAYDQAVKDLEAAQKASVESQTDMTRQTVDNLREIFELLGSTIKELRGQVDSVVKMQYATARSVITGAIVSGVLPSGEKLKESVESAKAGVQGTVYTSKFERDKAFLILANELESLQGIVEPQLSTAELTLQSLQVTEKSTLSIEQATRNLEKAQKDLLKAEEAAKLAKEQIAKIESQIKLAEDQVKELRGVNSGLLSLSNAMANLASAIANEAAAKKNATDASSALSMFSSGNFKGIYDLAMSGGYTVNDVAGTLGIKPEEVVKWVADAGLTPLKGTSTTAPVAVPSDKDRAQSMFTSGNYRGIYDLAMSGGYTSNDVAAALGITQAEVLAWAVANGLPAFASGGQYDGGLALVGETGPELINFNRGGLIHNANSTAQMLDNRAVVEAVERLNSNISALRQEVKLDSTTSSKMLRLLERVTPDGASLNVNVLP